MGLRPSTRGGCGSLGLMTPTIPVTVAFAERSFSKLKLIKSYLRSTMSQEKLSGLAILSIEKKMLEELKYKNLICQFASQKTRKIDFK